MAGLIAMMAVFLVVTVEMVFSILQGGEVAHCHSAVGEYDVLSAPSPAPYQTGFGSSRTSSGGRHRRSASIQTNLSRIDAGDDCSDEEFKLASFPLNNDSSTPRSDQDDSDASDTENLVARPVNGSARRSTHQRSLSNSSSLRISRRKPSRLSEEQQQKKALLQVILLEAGILFHSIFIGW